MKQITQILGIVGLLCLLAACGESHFMTDASYRSRVEQDFQQKKELMPQGDLFAIFNSDLTTYEREALEFLYAYMPLGDVTDYPGDFHLMNVRASQQTAQEMPWGKTIPEDLFRHFVLPVRINNERLDSARVVFYGELKDRVKSLSLHDAILEVNHWCHEKAVYTPSDSRTSSPLATVRTAHGRCGEESTFLVAALRSVGIPARQVYTPRWAHTDDNHAWVEAWADGKWYFLGACEPEPVLNLGWFNAPASRGMLMHTKVFGRYEGAEEVMSTTPNYTEINVIDNYAPTGKGSVIVKDEQGNTVADARVEFKLYNYAEFYTVATKQTDAAGACSLTAGKGDMLVWASKDGRFGFAKLSFDKQQELTVILDKKAGDSFTMDLDIVPPAENANLPEVTPEQRAQNNVRMAHEDSIRNAYVATMMKKEQARQWVDELYGEALQPEELKEKLVGFLVASRGNHETLKSFLSSLRDKTQKHTTAEEMRAIWLLENVSGKDLRDIRIEVLNDHLKNTADGEKMNPDLVKRALLSPRIANEELTPYKKELHEAIAKELPELITGNTVAADHNAGKLIAWCRENIKINNDLNSQRIPMSPMGVWKARVADEKSRDIFFVAAARSLGFPAWIDEVTGKVQFATEGPAQDVDFTTEAQPSQAPTGTLKAAYTPVPSLDNPKYYSHFTISKVNDGALRLLNYDEGDVDMGGGATWANLLKDGRKLDAGYYVLVSGTRLASGGVLARLASINVEADKQVSTDLVMRENKNEIQVIGNFNSESQFTPLAGGGKQTFLGTCGRGYFIVGILGVGQEPTNHALRDIAAFSADLEKWGRKMVLLFPNEAQSKKFHATEFPGLPSTIVYGIDTDGVSLQIAEAMKLKQKDTLPIFIIADTFNRVVFVSQGYTIGLGEQLMKTIKGL